MLIDLIFCLFKLNIELKYLLGDRYTEDENELRKHGVEVIGIRKIYPPQGVVFVKTTHEVAAIVQVWTYVLKKEIL